MDAGALHLATVATPLRKRCWGITAEVASTAFGTEEASLQQQLACLLAVVKVEEKVDVAATGFLKLEASIFVLVAHRLKQRAASQRIVFLEELSQGLLHPAHASIDSGHVPAD